ncbi:MAG TPA: NAD(P)/FAD-dependent oxidoreductase [Gaiellaceae bacterium]|nr:NAD(P)/FAD-dependent oxidoreductase [Gaiellaceae bacterium]
MSDCQVLVVGGGPGGSTTAALLAKQGFDVILMERQRFPRYHIGESLLPSALQILDELGLRETIESHGFQHKAGALFDWSDDIWHFSFGTPLEPLYAFQVVRSEFDQILLDHAASVGVDVRQRVEVVELEFDGERPRRATFVDGEGRRGSCSFDVLVDASGRTGLMATRYLRSRRFHEAFRNVALWGYWRNAAQLGRGPEGATASCSIPYGWIWAIPLHDGSLSVGVVLHKSRLKELRETKDLDTIYREALDSSPVVRDLVAPGELTGSLRTETDYSYAAERFSGPGYYLVGDAACFLDPLLSSGIHLATFSGLVAAASIASTLRGEIDEATASEFFGASYRRAYLRMLVVVSSFYQMHSGRDAFFKHAQELTMRDYSKQELTAAFVNVVSGVEDLVDMEQATSAEVLDSLMGVYSDHYEFLRGWRRGEVQSLDELRKGVGRMRVVDSAQGEFSLSPETAVNGLYVKTGSELGLAVASAASQPQRQEETSGSAR